MWIVVALCVVAGWCLLSVPLALLVGRMIGSGHPARVTRVPAHDAGPVGPVGQVGQVGQVGPVTTV